MNPKKILVVALGGAVALAIPAALLWYFLSSPFPSYSPDEFRFPDTVIDSKPSPTGAYIATLLYDQKSKNHFFAVSAPKGGTFISTERIVPPGAYQAPIFKLSWQDAATATLEVDWDFGSGNIIYVFNAKNLRFEKKL